MTTFFMNNQEIGPNAFYEVNTPNSRKAVIWMREHPEVMQWMMERAQQYKGWRKPFSAGLLAALYRHFVYVERDGATSIDATHEEYKMDSRVVFALGRTLVLRDPSLREFIKFRKIKGEWPTFGTEITEGATPIAPEEEEREEAPEDENDGSWYSNGNDFGYPN